MQGVVRKKSFTKVQQRYIYPHVRNCIAINFQRRFFPHSIFSDGAHAGAEAFGRPPSLHSQRHSSTSERFQWSIKENPPTVFIEENPQSTFVWKSADSWPDNSGKWRIRGGEGECSSWQLKSAAAATAAGLSVGLGDTLQLVLLLDSVAVARALE